MFFTNFIKPSTGLLPHFPSFSAYFTQPNWLFLFNSSRFNAAFCTHRLKRKRKFTKLSHLSLLLEHSYLSHPYFFAIATYHTRWSKKSKFFSTKNAVFGSITKRMFLHVVQTFNQKSAKMQTKDSIHWWMKNMFKFIRDVKSDKGPYGDKSLSL